MSFIELQDYYLSIFAKPLGEMTIVDLLSVAALPIAGVIALAVVFSAIGKAVDFYEWHFVWRKLDQKPPENKNP